MKNIMIHLKSRLTVIFYDLLMIPVAWFFAYWTLHNFGHVSESHIIKAVSVLPWLILIQGISFWFFGLYRGVWRFASLQDLFRISRAVLLGVLMTTAIAFFINRVEDIPRSIFALYGIYLLLFLGGSRAIYRYYKDKMTYDKPGKRILIIGAGRGGEVLVRNLLRDPFSEFTPVGFIDDDRKKFGIEIHGIRVLGNTQSLSVIVSRFNIEMVLIAIPTANSNVMRKLVSACEQADVIFRTLPGSREIRMANSLIDDLREVSINDLLGREPVPTDWNLISRNLKGKRILVTGAGGSIGSELCKQIASLNPELLVLLENSEYNLYRIDRALKRSSNDLNVVSVLSDVTEYESVDRVFAKYKPDIVFHAAAYKHVPLLESMIRTAIRNNVIGTKNVANISDKYQAEKFILISTDKAVNPTNIMGASKRIAELYIQNYNSRSNTEFITVRFGNVLESDGSVIPLFKEQIKKGGPVTVTDPDMTRYFMSIPEACELILKSSALGNGGEIFILDMGDPVKILYLAEQMIKLSGKEPYVDIDIKHIGLRPGEKIHEELFHKDEKILLTQQDKIFLAESRKVDWNDLKNTLEIMNNCCESFDETTLLELAIKLVPEMNINTTKSAIIIPLKAS